MRSEDMAHQSSLPNKFRLSFSTGVMKHPPDGFIPVLEDRQFLGGFLSISAISSDRMIRRLQDWTECFSSLSFTFCALQNVQIQVPTRPTSLVSPKTVSSPLQNQSTHLCEDTAKFSRLFIPFGAKFKNLPSIRNV